MLSVAGNVVFGLGVVLLLVIILSLVSSLLTDRQIRAHLRRAKGPAA